MKQLFRFVLVTVLALGAGTLAAPSAFAWSPMSVTTECSTDGQTLLWTVQASHTESDLNIQFADNAAFNNYSTHTLDSTTLSVQVSTSISVTQVWVRWASDNNVVSTGYAKEDCTPPPPTPPTGSIGGPCADPSYYGIFDNTAGSMAYKFRFRWFTPSGRHTRAKVVPAGMIFRTWEHWAKPGTLITVSYRDPVTGWHRLASATAQGGYFPPCEYQHGFSRPTS